MNIFTMVFFMLNYNKTVTKPEHHPSMKYFVFAWIVLCCSLPYAWSQSLESYRYMTDTTMVSASLGYAKSLDIWVPAAYESAHSQTRFPVILLFDRQNERSFGYILRSIDYLTSTEQMPAAILVGITSTMQARYETQREYDDVLQRLLQALPVSEMYTPEEKEEIRALLRELE